MPHPTPAPFAYGAATVVLSTFAMSLLSETRSGGAEAVIAASSLVLGLLVALTAPMPPVPRTSPPRETGSPLPQSAVRQSVRQQADAPGRAPAGTSTPPAGEGSGDG
jgi:hypothetical protein